MAKLVNKNIFDTGAKVIVNPVNCVGVMGKGLALEFKNRYPKNYNFYLKNYKSLTPGSILVYEDEVIIINAATKNHWIEKRAIRKIVLEVPLDIRPIIRIMVLD